MREDRAIGPNLVSKYSQAFPTWEERLNRVWIHLLAMFGQLSQHYRRFHTAIHLLRRYYDRNVGKSKLPILYGQTHYIPEQLYAMVPEISSSPQCRRRTTCSNQRSHAFRE